MGSAQGLLDAARSKLGLAESPAGSNHNNLTTWYASLHGGKYDPCPWCDIFVSWCAEVSGNVDATMGHHAWTVEHARAFNAVGRWHAGVGGIRPGDIVFFDWKGSRSISAIDHVGIVETVRANGAIVTIEGNTLNVCMRRVRGHGSIAGYGRPAYDGAPIVARLAVDGAFGPLTKKALQRRLGVMVDGIFGPITKRALQRLLGVTADGVVGPDTTRALQRRVGATVDGIWGPQTTRCLQSALNAGTL